jgi:hypothetical protein
MWIVVVPKEAAQELLFFGQDGMASQACSENHGKFLGKFPAKFPDFFHFLADQHVEATS